MASLKIPVGEYLFLWSHLLMVFVIRIATRTILLSFLFFMIFCLFIVIVHTKCVHLYI